MSNNFICPFCGCTSYHYNQTRAKDVCDQCGHLVTDEQEITKSRDYDKAVVAAKEHLKVGNWHECIDLLTPVCNYKPADPRAYMILLAALTEGYENMLLRRSTEEASSCWEKLMRLHKINGAMRTYQAKRELALRNHYRKKMIKSLIFISVILLILLLIPLFKIISGWLVFLDIVFCGWGMWYLFYELDPIWVFKKFYYLSHTRLDNPFKYDA